MSDENTAETRIREEAHRRLAELEPLVEEAARLRTILAVAEGEDAANGIRNGKKPSTYVPANKDQILAMVGESPGITAAEIARRSGMKRTVVASIVSRLKRSGELLSDGDGARLA